MLRRRHSLATVCYSSLRGCWSPQGSNPSFESEAVARSKAERLVIQRIGQSRCSRSARPCRRLLAPNLRAPHRGAARLADPRDRARRAPERDPSVSPSQHDFEKLQTFRIKIMRPKRAPHRLARRPTRSPPPARPRPRSPRPRPHGHHAQAPRRRARRHRRHPPRLVAVLWGVGSGAEGEICGDKLKLRGLNWPEAPHSKFVYGHA